MLQFELDEFFWVARAKLQVWAGFEKQQGRYGSQSSPYPSDGSVSITFAPEGRGTEPLSSAESKLIDWFLENYVQQTTAILSGILTEYPAIRRSYLDAYGDEGVSDLLPEISSIDDLRRLIRLHNINIHQVKKSDVPYIGYEFGCEWDDEHGLGVLMHANRIVEIGYADTAIHVWIAEEDAKTLP